MGYGTAIPASRADTVGLSLSSADPINNPLTICVTMSNLVVLQQNNTQPFTGKMPFLSANQQCQSTDIGRQNIVILENSRDDHFGVKTRRHPM